MRKIRFKDSRYLVYFYFMTQATNSKCIMLKKSVCSTANFLAVKELFEESTTTFHSIYTKSDEQIPIQVADTYFRRGISEVLT